MRKTMKTSHNKICWKSFRVNAYIYCKIRTISVIKLNTIVQLIAQPLKTLGSTAFQDRLILNFKQETI